MKRSGFLSAKKPNFSTNQIAGIRNIDSLKYKDWLGFSTGMITDAVSAYRTFNAVKDFGLIKDLAFASGIAAIAAIFGDMATTTVSFGSEITVISSEGITSVPNRIGPDRIEHGDAKTGVLGIYTSGDLTIEHTKVNVANITGVILGSLQLKHGTSRTQTSMQQERNGFDFTLSLSGLSIGPRVTSGTQVSTQVTPDSTSFFGQNIMLIMDNKLELEGAIVDGTHVNIGAAEVAVKNVLETAASKSDFESFGIGIAIGWSGSPMLTFTAGVGHNLKVNEFVRVISGITGKSISVVAKQISADLNQIMAARKSRC